MDSIKSKLETFYNSVFPFMADGIAKGGQLPAAAAILLEQGEVGLAPLGEIPSNRYSELQAYLLAKPGVVAVGIISESWVVEMDIAEMDKLDLSVRPSDHPNRKEAVLINFLCRDGTVYAAVCPIERPANTLVKGELREPAMMKEMPHEKAAA